LANGGAEVKVGLSLVPADLDRYQVFVFSRPQTSTDLVSGLKACLQAGKRVVIDLDEDFHNLPHEHPKYALYGSQDSLRVLEDLLAQAGLLTVPSRLLAERYKKFVPHVEIIPSSWSGSGSLWNKPAPRRQTVNIGLLGAHTHPKDIFLLKKDLARLLKEFPQALLAIGQHLELYEAFSSIPEDRKLFFPDVRLEDYPFLVANFDLLLFPLRDNAYNQSRPDLPLLEAGIRRIPWVASSIPAFKEWGAGGLFAEKAGDWYAAVRRLLDEPELRQELGQAGRQNAEGRETEKMIPRWREALWIG
jgi:glycosyltransferase involved in cell wall biosynthesis